MRFSKVLLAALLVLLGLTPMGRADESSFRDLLRRLPESTNALIVADIQGLRKALGVDKDTPLESADLPSLPVTANRFVLGANIDVAHRRHNWSVAIAEMARRSPLADIAKAINEPLDKMEDRDVVPSPQNAYFVDLGGKVLACRTPANRQELKRWLAFQKRNQFPDIPQYLLQAANPENPALIVMAIDLADSLSPTAVHRGLDRSQVMQSRDASDIDNAAALIAHVQGLTLVVRAGKPLSAELTVDFDRETRSVLPYARPLLLEALKNVGVYVPDFDHWKPRFKHRSIGIYGRLSPNSLRKFASLVRTPAPPPETANLENYKRMTPEQRKVAASKRYFKSISQLLADLRLEKAKTWQSLGNWYDNYANQIGSLSVLDVDPQLVNYGEATAGHLRELGRYLNGVYRAKGQLRANSYNVNPAYGVSGSYVRAPDGSILTQSQVQNYLSGEGKAGLDKLWQMVDDATTQIREAMTMKYMVDF
jgi:hypothetical protein